MAIPAAQAQTTWYVDDANCPGPGSGTEADPFCLIQHGIDAAVNGDTVVVADGTYTGDGNRDLNFGGRLITVHSANGPDNCIIDCEGAGRAFIFENGETADATVDGLTITGGSSLGGGGMFNQSSSPTVTHCTFDGNSANRGGGMYNINSSPTVSNCSFSGNTATTFGGGMFNQSSSPTVTNCTFDGNSATNGGGMYNVNSNPTVTKSTFDGNSATNGGGMYCTSSSPTISNCTFTENIVTGTGVAFNSGLGGAIRSSFGNLTIECCTFTRNTAIAGSVDHTGDGGGIFLGDRGDSSTTSIENCTFIENAAIGGAALQTGFGGGMVCNFANMSLRDSVFVGNTATHGSSFATGNAGAIAVSLNSEVNITNCTIIGNRALGGSEVFQGVGGAMWSFGSSPILTGCKFAANVSTGNGFISGGGAIVFTDGVVPELRNCTLIGNQAVGVGGGVFYVGSALDTFPIITNSTISGNMAGSDGGGIYATDIGGTDVDAIVQNSIVWENPPNEIVSDGAGAVITVSFSDVMGGWEGPGENNINEDPLFVDGPSGTWTADGVYDMNAGQTTLFDDNANGGKGWDEDTLAGMFINPNLAQTLQSVIVTNTATTVTVWSNFADLGTTGANYQIRDYHLTDGSPVIDAADSTAVPSDTTDLDDDGDTDEQIPFDIDGNPRFVDDPLTPNTGARGCLPVDMGAYEYQEGSSDCPCPADLDGDGQVRVPDLIIMLAAWGPNPGHLADLDGNGEVRVPDLIILLAAWGLCN